MFQHPGEFEQLLEIYRRRNPAHVLEIGSYYGGSLYHWLQNAQPGALVVSVDLPPPHTDQGLWTSWVPPGVTFLPIRGDSRDPAVVRQVELSAPYDWVFIDAGHYYQEVGADWLNYGPMVDDGIIAFHDILEGHGHPEIEVHRLWDEIRAAFPMAWEEIIEDENADWGGIGVFVTARATFE